MSCLYFLSRTMSSSERAQLAVHLHAREALGPQLLQLLAVLALAPADDRRHDHEAGALLHPHDLVDDLLGRLRGDRPPAVEAVRLADPRPQQAQVVVDLRDRPDRRPRVARRGLLVDRDRRRQPLDRVHVRLVHLPQELARVRAQRLHVPALALRVDRVERQRRLARAGQAGDDHQRVPRQRDRDVLEVVLAGAGDDDGVLAARHKTALHSRRAPDGFVEQTFARPLGGERGRARSAIRHRAACPRDSPSHGSTLSSSPVARRSSSRDSYLRPWRVDVLAQPLAQRREVAGSRSGSSMSGRSSDQRAPQLGRHQVPDRVRREVADHPGAPVDVLQDALHHARDLEAEQPVRRLVPGVRAARRR